MRTTQRGCHSEAMDREFRKAGFYRILQPKLFGGYEFDYPTFYRTMLNIARGNPGVAWCLALGATHDSLVASHWPERAQYRAVRKHRRLHRSAPGGRHHQYLRVRRRRLCGRRHLELLFRHSLRDAFRRQRRPARERQAPRPDLCDPARAAHRVAGLGRRRDARHARQRLQQREDRQGVRPRAPGDPGHARPVVERADE